MAEPYAGNVWGYNLKTKEFFIVDIDDTFKPDPACVYIAADTLQDAKDKIINEQNKFLIALETDKSPEFQAFLKHHGIEKD